MVVAGGCRCAQATALQRRVPRLLPWLVESASSAKGPCTLCKRCIRGNWTIVRVSLTTIFSTISEPDRGLPSITRLNRRIAVCHSVSPRLLSVSPRQAFLLYSNLPLYNVRLPSPAFPGGNSDLTSFGPREARVSIIFLRRFGN